MLASPDTFTDHKKPLERSSDTPTCHQCPRVGRRRKRLDNQTSLPCLVGTARQVGRSAAAVCVSAMVGATVAVEGAVSKLVLSRRHVTGRLRRGEGARQAIFSQCAVFTPARATRKSVLSTSFPGRLRWRSSRPSACPQSRKNSFSRRSFDGGHRSDHRCDADDRSRGSDSTRCPDQAGRRCERLQASSDTRTLVTCRRVGRPLERFFVISKRARAC